MKELCGLEIKKAYNRRFEDRRLKECPKDAVEKIKDAFIHFNII